VEGWRVFGEEELKVEGGREEGREEVEQRGLGGVEVGQSSIRGRWSWWDLEGRHLIACPVSF